jgi:DNA polymerase III subunit delta'
MVEVGSMDFESVVGQRRVVGNLIASISNGKMAHAFLLTGQQGVGKDALALALALGMNCRNQTPGGCGGCAACARLLRLEDPGFHFIHPVPSRPKTMKAEKYNEILHDRAVRRLENPYKAVNFAPELSTPPVIGIDTVRALRQEARLMLFGGGKRVVLISHAEKMTVPAANSLLKILEEPPEDTVLLLTTSVPGQMLSTILSRCQRIRLDMLSDQDIEEALIRRWLVPAERARVLARMSGGSMQRALELSDDDFEWKRDSAFELLETLVAENPIVRIDGFEILQKNTDKPVLREVLQILLMLLRDLQQLRLMQRDRLLNADRLNRLEAFQERHPALDLDRMSRGVLRAIDFIQKNVYLPLVLFSLDQLHLQQER